MPASFKVELKGAIELRKEADRIVRDMQGGPMLNAIRQASLLVTATARREAKADRGIWRNSIIPEVRVLGSVVEGIVGSNLAYAPFADLDTKPHWPPMQPIYEWVRRKRLGGTYSPKTRRRQGSKSLQEQQDRSIAYLIARKISKVGTKGDHALEKGLEKNAHKIIALIEKAASQIMGD